MLSGGRSVKEPKEQIVFEGFGEQEDLSIGEVEVVREALIIKDVGRRKAVCRSFIAESGVKIGEQGDPRGGDGLHYGEGQEG